MPIWPVLTKIMSITRTPSGMVCTEGGRCGLTSAAAYGLTPPSLLRNATAPNRGGLGKEMKLYAMPRAPLLAGAVAAGDWGVVQRSSCPEAMP